MKLPIYIYAIFFSTLSGFFALYKRKLNTFYLKVFPFFLILTILVEFTGSFIIRVQKQENTTFLYNFFTTFEFGFYIWVIREIIRNNKSKKILFFLMLFYPLVAIINIIFFQGKEGFHTFTYSLGCLLIVGCCIYYFYELFLMPHSVNLLRQPPFWICTALLFFYAFTYPIYGLSNLMMSLPRPILKNIEGIVTYLNVFLYSFFSIAFLCRIRIQK